MKFEISLDDAYEIAECIVNCDLSVEEAQEYFKSILLEINKIED